LLFSPRAIFVTLPCISHQANLDLLPDSFHLPHLIAAPEEREAQTWCEAVADGDGLWG
jgi:hypothetical protein